MISGNDSSNGSISAGGRSLRRSCTVAFRQAQASDDNGGYLCTLSGGVDGIVFAMHDVVVNAIFHIRICVWNAIESLSVGLILGKEEFWLPFAVEPARPIKATELVPSGFVCTTR